MLLLLFALGATPARSQAPGTPRGQFWLELGDGGHRRYVQHRQQGWHALAIGRLDTAGAAAAAMIRVAPERAEGHCLQGAVHEGQGRPELALVAFDRAEAVGGANHCLVLEEGAPRGGPSQGRSLSQGRSQGAELEARVVIAKARALLALGRVVLARQWLGSRVPLLEAGSRRGDAYELLGDLHQLQGEAEFSAARRAYRHSHRFLGLALMLHRQGDASAACRLFRGGREQVRTRDLERRSRLPGSEVFARKALAAECASEPEAASLWQRALQEADGTDWPWSEHARRRAGAQ